MSGYIYRLCPADAAQLRKLVADIVGTPCYTFGGAALWDLDPAQEQTNLRPITKLTDADALSGLEMKGDFGHAFSCKAEVRWKRLDEEHYDVLVLSEELLNNTEASALGSDWTIREPQNTIIQSGERNALKYVLYQAPNGAVQFLRYTTEETR